MMKVGVFCGQLGFLAPSIPTLNSTHSYFLRIHNNHGASPLKLAVFAPNYATHHHHHRDCTFVVASSASSSPSFGGSEQFLDVGVKKKKEGIAGLDQDELMDPKLLADNDSCFCQFQGVEIHHKIQDAAESQSQSAFQNHGVSHQIKKPGFPMILLHGFGASVFSWKQVMKPLAEVTGSKVLAFDRPAFGLTSRLNLSKHLSSGKGDAKPLNPYSMAFSVLVTLYFLDMLNAEKAILVGHSAGSLVAVNTYFEAPERVAALILVAPAIFAPLTKPKIVKENPSRQDNQMKEESNAVSQNPILEFYNMLFNFAKFIANAIAKMMRGMINMLNSLYRKFLSAILRSSVAIMLVRMAINKFGTSAVRNAWYDPKQVSDDVLSGYTKPLRIKDWDKALVEFTAAMLLDEESKTKPSLSQRLNDISCPVLIVTGDTDRLVPSWNAERLSHVIPGASFAIIKQCGHLPHEEKVEEFISIVENFLKRLVTDSNEQYLQTIT
ncbi:uncharacterized protein LOC107470145 isoform X1 [Arachis duranensis]|uniref:Uncharacterized protein LOC107470145 isoform X1 n=1 Tax=Arachis duranensis TaxID=130453 RepID=A0A6P4BN92_ARADU|nr:uncharacterized protein LOC107470145 isoform X1 [Arachis duranensis]